MSSFRKITIVYLLFLHNFTLQAAKKVLIIATEPTYPPYEYINSKGEIKGFDIDVIKAVCKKLNRKYKIVPQNSFDALILGVQTNKFDIAIGAISINEERKKQVSFSNSYFEDCIGIIVPKNSNILLNKKSLNGKIVGLQSGTVFEEYILQNFSKELDIKRYSSVSEGLLDMKNNRIDMFAGDSSILKYWILKNKETNYKVIEIKDKKYISQLAIAVNKTNHVLLKNINKALTEINKNNDLHKISKTYFNYKKENFNLYIYQIFQGALNTILIAMLSLIIGLFLTIIFAIIQLSNNIVLKSLLKIFIFLLRSLPELLVITSFYFLIPIFLKKIHLITTDINPIILTIIALGLVFASYGNTLIVAAYYNIHIGQKKAAYSLGLSKTSTLKKILLPQILRNVYPGLYNLWLTLLKDTSLVALVGVTEIMNKAKLAASSSGKYFMFYSIAALLYLLITSFFNFIFKKFKYNL